MIGDNFVHNDCEISGNSKEREETMKHWSIQTLYTKSSIAEKQPLVHWTSIKHAHYVFIVTLEIS